MKTYASRVSVAPIVALAVLCISVPVRGILIDTGDLDPVGDVVVDGYITGWNLTDDWIAPMWLSMQASSHPNPQILADLFMRYDSNAEIIYTLVLPREGNYVVIKQGEEDRRDDSHLKFEDPDSNSSGKSGQEKLFDGENDQAQKDDLSIFRWIDAFHASVDDDYNITSIGSGDWQLAAGWEAAGQLDSGLWELTVKTRIFPGDTALAELSDNGEDMPPTDPPPQVGAIPEPASGALALLGVLTLGGYAGRRRPRGNGRRVLR